MAKELLITKANTRFTFDPQAEPVAHADPGDTVRFECMDCYIEQIDCDGKDFSLIDLHECNPATGPLYVNGAEPGDALKVEILAIDLADSGAMCVRRGIGSYEMEGSHCRRFDVRDGVIEFDKGIRVPVKPMIGVIGTAPADGPISSEDPGEHGGNMDIRELGAGTTLYLPVNVPGALLSMGDIHAVMGDGETAICGLEINGTVTVRVSVIKAPHIIPTPFLVTDTACYTTAADLTLDECSIKAARKMHRWMVSRFDLTEPQAAMLLSLQGNLRISQIVNPHKGCIMEMPRSILEQCAPKK